MKKKIGFYIFLFVCMIGLGVSAFLLNQGKTDKTSTHTASVVRSQIDFAPSSRPVSSEPVSAVVSEEESSSEVSSEVPTVAKADFFVYPLSGEIITDFSKDNLIFSKTYNDWRSHLAIDIKGAFGESVHAAGDGVVQEVFYDELYGNTIVIDHGNGIEFSYCGLDETNFKQGQTVLVNDTIGTLGDLPCESLDGVHLHLQAKKDGKEMDPLDLIS